MPLSIANSRDCGHSKIEPLGNDHDARFFRCRGCGQVFIVQGGLTLSVPAVPPQPRPVESGDETPTTFSLGKA